MRTRGQDEFLPDSAERDGILVEVGLGLAKNLA
jgi:hypothetical protein